MEVVRFHSQNSDSPYLAIMEKHALITIQSRLGSGGKMRATAMGTELHILKQLLHATYFLRNVAGIF